MASFRLSLALVGLYASQALASCAHGTMLLRRAEAGEKPAFGYTGNIGPMNWANLAEANALCSTGTNQSPIDMVNGVFNVIPGSSLNLKIPDMSNGTAFENLGTTVEVIAEQGGSMSVGGTDYTLRQFHFHLPSEHLDAGTSMAMEMHMVFESADAKLAVIGTYIGIDEASGATPAPPTATEAPATPAEKRALPRFNRRKSVAEEKYKRAAAIMGSTPIDAKVAASPLLETVLTNVKSIPTAGTTVRTPPLVMSEVVSLLSAGSFQSYMGSLTTPPCSEGVQWLVSTQKLSVKASTFVGVRDVVGFNSRFTQNAPGEPNVLQFARGGAATAPAAPAA
ncbi:alpha carbonic anhydrase [Plectosphaerella plurivora]|uniref:carbonic anhydrase n=1 Tax=Plectosphaerella plurivora TaxID=936078 RepID=A0A9P8VFP2_9PEZI|nr:alpha carbonic anhydrase [Plectosphaerella plurivora]